jgi:hypothetical protein
LPRTPRKKAASPNRRMADYRARMRARGLRPVQIWAPDTRDPAFIARIRREVKALAAHDPAGDEVMREIEAGYEWPVYEWKED